MSQRAFESYARQEFGTPPEEWYMVMLALALFQRWSDDGWEMQVNDALGMTMPFPTAAFAADPPTASFLNWRHLGSTLSCSVGALDLQAAQRVHDFTAGWHELPEGPTACASRISP